ncbi:MAG: GNAT family N-acetyltransferase [Planctomycetota bacterium]
MTVPVDGNGPRPFLARCRDTVLRPVERADADALYPHVHGRPEVTRWLCWAGPDSLEDLRFRYRTWKYGADAEPAFLFALVGATDGAVLGEGSLRFDEHPGVGELGYWLAEPYHGHGHGRDAVELLCRVGYELCGAFALLARVKEGNEASIRVLLRTGFVQERAPRPAEDDVTSVDAGIAWVFTSTRRSDERREGRLEVRIEADREPSEPPGIETPDRG